MHSGKFSTIFFCPLIHELYRQINNGQQFASLGFVYKNSTQGQMEYLHGEPAFHP